MDLCSKQTKYSAQLNDLNETKTEKNREGDMFAVLLKEIQEGNNTLLQKIDSKTTDLQMSIKNLHSTVSSLLERVMVDEQYIGDTKDEVRRIDGLMKEIRQENETLKDKVEYLETTADAATYVEWVWRKATKEATP